MEFGPNFQRTNVPPSKLLYLFCRSDIEPDYVGLYSVAWRCLTVFNLPILQQPSGPRLLTNMIIAIKVK